MSFFPPGQPCCRCSRFTLRWFIHFVWSVVLKNLCLKGYLAIPLTPTPPTEKESRHPYPFTWTYKTEGGRKWEGLRCRNGTGPKPLKSTPNSASQKKSNQSRILVWCESHNAKEKSNWLHKKILPRTLILDQDPDLKIFRMLPHLSSTLLTVWERLNREIN